MKLYIKIVENHPVDHPITEENFKQAFPDIDTENLPAEFAVFERVDKPEIGPYEAYGIVSYVITEEGTVTELHRVLTMTEQQKTAKQNKVKEEWKSYASWIFNEETCAFEPPVAQPDDGNIYSWNEEQLNWQLVEKQELA
jgi:hypothetical protein